jgi:hypothetical protein
MVTPVERHRIAIRAPWYAPGRRAAIHRYLETNFIQLFQSDVARSPDPAKLFAWEAEDRLPLDAGGRPGALKLRRPAHRVFHIVCWEAHCDIPGLPTLSPEKIISAGFALRMGDAAAPIGFHIAQGRPQGWAPVETDADPDSARELKRLGLAPRDAAPPAAFTGEETFPLHVLAVTDGGRPHTLLYGYLPLGGGDYTPPETTRTADAGPAPEELPWPFGLGDRQNAPPPSAYTFDRMIVQRSIDSRLAAVLRVLLIRYGLATPAGWTDPENATLVALLDSLHFYADPQGDLSAKALRDWAAAHPAPNRATLGSVLRDAATVAALMKSLTKSDPTQNATLPESAPVASQACNLLVVESAAAQLRAALKARLVHNIAATTASLPLPKLISGGPARYVATPFVRVNRGDGCECPYWGAPSEAFAVAAFFDPAAARPRLIEMPDLSDALQGAARGASFDMPPGLADLVNSFSTADAAQGLLKGGGGQPTKLGLRFICSFSLPAIMICAMLILSIVLSLLNIVFGWMAWVKICLPIPTKK